ncbi:MAG: YeiH family protein [Desulfovibrio sp.]|nr:YeiH family protein [Desulfovibrio sp.]
MSQNSDIVVDRAKSQWSDLWKKEDYWAIWLGLFILAVALCVVMSNKTELQNKSRPYLATILQEKAKPFKTIEFYDAKANLKKIQGRDLPFLKKVLGLLATPGSWHSNPLDSLSLSEETAKAANDKLQPKIDAAKKASADALALARQAQDAAASAGYKDEALNSAAATAISAWQKAEGDVSKITKKIKKPFSRYASLIGLGILLGVLTTFGATFMGYNPVKFFLGFLGIYFLCVLAQIMGKQDVMKGWGLNAEIWSIVIGMLIANTIGTPQWIKYSAQVEYFIKTGLVLLGADVLIYKLMAIGIPGIFVAWVVTPIVLVTTYIFGQKVLKIPSPTLNIVISADMSVCGTSAAIATAAAAQAKKEELTLSIGLSLTFTAIMMVVIPAIIRATGMPEILGGAWIGGTIDATGAVAAAGAFVGPKAMQVAATVKMIQNVLIGVTAFFVAIYFTTKVHRNEGEKVGAMEIWHRFPKFVLGFLGVSIICSIICSNLGADTATILIENGTNKIGGGFRGWFFALAFISIGLTTNFRELSSYLKGGKPIILYVCGQAFNLFLTLLMAWFMFYKVFPEITAKI